VTVYWHVIRSRQSDTNCDEARPQDWLSPADYVEEDVEVGWQRQWSSCWAGCRT
jgi:hypothetical protein